MTAQSWLSRWLGTLPALVALLAAARLAQLQQLYLTGHCAQGECGLGCDHRDGFVDLCPLFRASPQLHYLSLRSIPLEDFSAFALLPRLHTLRDIS
jgi:hypothetical protein